MADLLEAVRRHHAASVRAQLGGDAGAMAEANRRLWVDAGLLDDRPDPDEVVDLTGRLYVLDLPDLERYSLNQSRGAHWAKQREILDTWKHTVRMLAVSELNGGRWPKMERVTVQLVQRPRIDRRRDHDNLAPMLKACVDGLVAAKVIPDDNTSHVLAATSHIAAPDPRRPAGWQLHVTNLDEHGG